jgi:hypothetical protein
MKPWLVCVHFASSVKGINCCMCDVIHVLITKGTVQNIIIICVSHSSKKIWCYILDNLSPQLTLKL